MVRNLREVILEEPLGNGPVIRLSTDIKIDEMTWTENPMWCGRIKHAIPNIKE